ncbi:HD domain-containing protein [Halegenticoccus tardaugens]|uniref:HD domain-containing protein n=1 Tax=Halegenticoccus tardaugens TaxID=2071624 RepID=UPI00100BF6E1|nr:HD domain-containing protein [Halegenticoccus tardaugens]
MPQRVGPLARTLALPYYEDALPAHDSFHANRVRDLSLRLANECERAVDRDVLSAAAWLHDIGRPLERSGEIDDHGKWATVEAEELLEAKEVPADQLEAIKHCIRAHSIRASSPDPETLEAELLFDADKLDTTGAVGIARLACIVGERSGRAGEKYAVIDDLSAPRRVTSDHPDVSLLQEWARERLDELHTGPARRLGKSRWEFMEDFFARFNDEIGLEGER